MSARVVTSMSRPMTARSPDEIAADLEARIHDFDLNDQPNEWGFAYEHMGDMWRQMCKDVALLREAAEALRTTQFHIDSATEITRMADAFEAERDALIALVAEWYVNPFIGTEEYGALPESVRQRIEAHDA